MGGKLVCLDSHCPTELSAITEISELSNMVAINHMCLLDTWNVTRVNEELSFKFYSSLMDLNWSWNGHMYLEATILDNTDLGYRG